MAELFPEENLAEFHVTMDYNGKPRTYDISKPDDVFPYLTITDKLTFTDGHPDFDSINQECIIVRDQLRELIEPKAKS